jgi:hypothetical protein
MIKSSDEKNSLKDTNMIKIVCPTCNTEKQLNINNSLIKSNQRLTTLSIPKGLICEHHFQAFIDKNFRVRGYQKVDFIFPVNDNKTKHNKRKEKRNVIVNSKRIFTEKQRNKAETQDKKREEMTLEEVYEKYWHLIEDDSKTFQKFIKNDKRRKNRLK